MSRTYTAEEWASMVPSPPGKTEPQPDGSVTLHGFYTPDPEDWDLNNNPDIIRLPYRPIPKDEPEPVAEVTPEPEPVETITVEFGGNGPEDYRQAEWLAQRLNHEWKFDHRTQRWHGLSKVGIWLPDEQEAIYRAVAKSAAKALGADRVAESEQKRLFALLQVPNQERVLKALRTSPTYSTTGRDWDQNGLLLGVENGVYDFKARQVRKGESADLITKVCGTRYDLKAPEPTRFLRFLDELYAGDKDMVEFMKRAIGSLLVGGYVKAFLVLLGDTDTGKSTLIALLKALLGSYVTPLRIASFSRASFQNPGSSHTRDLMRLPGARFTYAVESDENTVLDTALLKSMTGGEPVVLSAPYSKEQHEHDVTWKVWLGTNTAPKVKDESDATWNRMQLVPHPVRFWKAADPSRPAGAPVQDPELLGALVKELPGILRLAVEWATEYIDAKYMLLPLPQAGRDAITELQRDDDLSAFFDMWLVKEEGSSVLAGEAYNLYVRNTSDRDTMSNTRFGSLLGKRATRKSKDKGGGYRYHGIRFQTASERSG
jgi:putative DNA primase/helicase